MTPVIIFGGYGTFGSHVSKELAKIGIPLAIAGRNLEKAQTFAKQLGTEHQAIQADIAKPETYREQLQRFKVVVNCAGPFSSFGTNLLAEALAAKCHYTDIADDRDYVEQVISFHSRFKAENLCAVYGCSSLPAISGALAFSLCEKLPEKTEPPARARITLFIGNNNPKGQGAVESALEVLGKAIKAPQGFLYGFRDREIVPLPSPFGARAVYNFESPEYDLFPKELNIQHIVVKVGFELKVITKAFNLIATLPTPIRKFLSPFLAQGRRFNLPIGCSGGVVMSELFWKDGTQHRGSIFSDKEGQRMAALPCAFVTKKLCESAPSTYGVQTAYNFLGSENLIKSLINEGFQLEVVPSIEKNNKKK